MKRFLVAILACVYMMSAMGITMHMHYCMGKFVSASLIQHNGDHFCSLCGMKKSSSKKGCCKDETKQFKSDDQLKSSLVTFSFHYDELTAIPHTQIFSSPSLSCAGNAINCSSAHAPPAFRHNCPIYLEVRNIRI